jgi:hypothetical protein
MREKIERSSCILSTIKTGITHPFLCRECAEFVDHDVLGVEFIELGSLKLRPRHHELNYIINRVK